MGADFSPRSNLNRHVEPVHEGKKSFKCNVCDTAFSEKSNGILNQFTKERSLSNVMCVIQSFLKKVS